jgi:prevent-host-death family protein
MELRMDLADVKARFSDVVQDAMLGATVVITTENRPVLRITAIKPTRRVPGTGKGVWMAPDFDAPPTDFADYM